MLSDNNKPPADKQLVHLLATQLAAGKIAGIVLNDSVSFFMLNIILLEMGLSQLLCKAKMVKKINSISVCLLLMFIACNLNDITT